MGCCCGKDKDDDPPLLDNEHDEIVNQTNDNGIDGDGFLSESTIKPDPGNLLSTQNDSVWNTPATEQLQHELEKEIAVRQYKNDRNEQHIDQLDEELDHSLEINIDNDKERRPSNLFRYESNKEWNATDLEHQENSLQHEIENLSKKHKQIDSVNDC